MFKEKKEARLRADVERLSRDVSTMTSTLSKIRVPHFVIGDLHHAIETLKPLVRACERVLADKKILERFEADRRYMEDQFKQAARRLEYALLVCRPDGSSSGGGAQSETLKAAFREIDTVFKKLTALSKDFSSIGR